MINEQIIQIKSREHLTELMSVNTPIVLYFTLPDCNVCHDVFPKFMEIVNEHPIKVARIDINEQKEIAGQNLIFTVPTIMIMNEGKEILKESRFIDFEKIERTLELLVD